MKQLRYALSVIIVASMCVSCSAAEKEEIKAAEIVRLLKKGKPVQIVDKIITGDLDFTQDGAPVIFSAAALQREVQSNVFFSGCIFTGRVTSNRAGGKDKLPVRSCFRNNLVFVSCDFRGEVDFRDATVFGTVNFSQSVFRENASFNHLAVWAKDSYFSEIAAEKDFSVIYAAFAGNLYCINAKFAADVSFQETSVKGKLMFDHNTVAGRADFSMMEMSGNAFFHHTQFAKHADFSSTRFLSSVDFTQTVFGGKIFEHAFFLFKTDSMNVWYLSTEKLRELWAEQSEKRLDLLPVQSSAEQLTYNGNSYPIIGYGIENSRKEIIVTLSSEYLPNFGEEAGQDIISHALNQLPVTINTGLYAGDHQMWYIYAKREWKRFNLYINTPWIPRNQIPD
ncbi:MAG: pentapeptide repeat-containing protein [Bacteroidales bacterium]|jgi:uncharacterized protein YjbI with pentapeptide repeats|nr:pentapeptide repeat-containing protein [Bacteroidales bacterium]